jgi:predicted nucleotidyltransferase component of viral defense system
MMVSTSSLNVLDRPLVERIAAGLLTSPGLVEKDWHVTRALGVLARFDHGAAVPAFGGGTSLSKGWGLIKRFSEDIDFKVAMPVAASRSKARNERSDYRERILTALTEAEFTLDGEPVKRDESQFFSVNLFYPSLFVAGPGLRPHLRVEMTLTPPALPPVARSIASLIGMAQQKPPEIQAFLCVDPVETAADKLSALAWRVHARQRGSVKDDPTIIRHLHDLAALRETVAASDGFVDLVRQAAAGDAAGEGGDGVDRPGGAAVRYAGEAHRR